MTATFDRLASAKAAIVDDAYADYLDRRRQDYAPSSFCDGCGEYIAGGKVCGCPEVPPGQVQCQSCGEWIEQDEARDVPVEINCGRYGTEQRCWECA